MSNGILSLLLGLGGGYLQGSQQRQQSAQQDQDRERRNQLQDLQIADMQRRAQQSQMAPYLSDLDHASAHYSQNPDALSQLSQRKAGLLNGGLQVTGVDAPAQGPNFAAGTGPIPVKPRTLASTLSGLNLGQSDQQRQADATQRNSVTGKLFGDLNDFEHPEAIGQAITALNSGAKLGSMVPGRVVTEQKDLPENASSVGFEGNIPPSLPPNTVDLADVYQRAGRTKAQLHEDERAKLELQREQGRLNLETLRANPRMARAEADFRAKVEKSYDQIGGSPEYRSAFVENEVANWKRSAPLAPAAPGTPTPLAPAVPAAPTSAQAFPNGTTALAGIKEKNAKAGLEGAKTADVAAAAADRKARTQAYVDSVKSAQSYREALAKAKELDRQSRENIAGNRLSFDEKKLEWTQRLEGYKAAFQKWQAETAGAKGGAKSDPVLTQKATLLRQRIGRVEAQINKLPANDTSKEGQLLRQGWQDLLRDFDTLTKQPQSGAAAPRLTPAPSLPGGGGIPALPAVGVNMNSRTPAPQAGGDQQEQRRAVTFGGKTYQNVSYSKLVSALGKQQADRIWSAR